MANLKENNDPKFSLRFKNLIPTRSLTDSLKERMLHGNLNSRNRNGESSHIGMGGVVTVEGAIISLVESLDGGDPNKDSRSNTSLLENPGGNEGHQNTGDALKVDSSDEDDKEGMEA